MSEFFYFVIACFLAVVAADFIVAGVRLMLGTHRPDPYDKEQTDDTR